MKILTKLMKLTQELFVSQGITVVLVKILATLHCLSNII